MIVGHDPLPVTEFDIPVYLFYTEQGDGGNRKAVSRVDDTIDFAQCPPFGRALRVCREL